MATPHTPLHIFFCTELGELVLVDVTGGNDKKVKLHRGLHASRTRSLTMFCTVWFWPHLPLVPA